jgi:hypothetical protein
MSYLLLKETYTTNKINKYGYNTNKKSLANLFPNNIEEAQIVENRLKNITEDEKAIFLESDENYVHLFNSITNEPDEKLDLFLMNTINPHILKIKKKINRARPFQVNNYINKNRIKSTTANTAAFPSGHSMQTYFLAKNLALLYPKKANKLFQLAENIGQSRIAAGHHYPSDHEYGKWLIDNIYFNKLPKYI